MASSFGGGLHHLDASNGREVVYCHACSHEWYRNLEREALECPGCGSEAIEIVENGSDPRPGMGPSLADSSSFFSGNRPRGRPGPGTDSDPEEADIEGLNLRTAFGATRSPFDRDPFGSPGNNRDQDPFPAQPNPAEMITRILETFMTQGLPGRGGGGGGGGGGGAQGGANGGATFTHEDLPGGTTIHRSTFSNGPNSSFTITTATSASRGGGPSNMRRIGGGGPGDSFGMLFNDLLGGGGNSSRNNNNNNNDQNQPQPPGLMDFGFHQLLASVFNPAGAVHGDAVYTQEALDRIITRLMEASPPTNAAPPASSEAIQALEKKIVDDEMLGADGKAECTICMEEVKKGKDVTMLPCKHWYHGECIVPWLQQHETCPICRKPVSERGQQQQGGSGPGSPPVPNQPPTGSTPPTNPSPPPMPGSFFYSTFGGLSGGGGEASGSGNGNGSGSGGDTRDNRGMSPQERLNRIRNLAGLAGVEAGASSGGGSGNNSRRVSSPPGAWPGSSAFSWQNDDSGRTNRRFSTWASGGGTNEEGTTSATATPSMGRSSGNWGSLLGGSGGGSGSGRAEDGWTSGGTSRTTQGRERVNRWSNSGSGSSSSRDRDRERDRREGSGSTGNGNGGGNGSGHSGPFSWLRDQFRGGGRR